jgi:hypothetical protein
MKKQIKIKDGLITAKIVDAELDEIQCTFNNDGCVELNTYSASYIILTVDNLLNLIELIEEAELKYSKL